MVIIILLQFQKKERNISKSKYSLCMECNKNVNHILQQVKAKINISGFNGIYANSFDLIIQITETINRSKE